MLMLEPASILTLESFRRLPPIVHKGNPGSSDPRSIGQALHGSRLGEFWKYRVGDYGLISKIEDDRLLVLVVRIGHRREIYR